MNESHERSHERSESLANLESKLSSQIKFKYPPKGGYLNLVLDGILFYPPQSTSGTADAPDTSALL
jgi:hypothetical protein